MTYPTYPSPPPALPVERPTPPRALRPVVALLLTNLGLSIVLTIAVLILRHSVIDYQLAHRHIAPGQRSVTRHALSVTIWSRVFGNLVVSIVYTFLVRALLRGRRWAYRRVLFISIAGMVGLLLIFISPYPAWMRIEQCVQVVVLAALLYFVTRPEVRAYCVDTRRRFQH